MLKAIYVSAWRAETSDHATFSVADSDFDRINKAVNWRRAQYRKSSNSRKLTGTTSS